MKLLWWLSTLVLRIFQLCFMKKLTNVSKLWSEIQFWLFQVKVQPTEIFNHTEGRGDRSSFSTGNEVIKNYYKDSQRILINSHNWLEHDRFGQDSQFEIIAETFHQPPDEFRLAKGIRKFSIKNLVIIWLMELYWYLVWSVKWKA